MKKLLLLLTLTFASHAQLAFSQECTMGEVRYFAMSWCPRYHLVAWGQTLPIAEYQALYSLLGTQFGGDGRVTFSLPDLRGRTVVGAGRGPGLTDRMNGQMSGTEQSQLTVGNLPPHNHKLMAHTGRPRSHAPAGKSLAGAGAYANTSPSAPLSSASISIEGQATPFNNMMPYTVLTACICANGMYPPRS